MFEIISFYLKLQSQMLKTFDWNVVERVMRKEEEKMKTKKKDDEDEDKSFVQPNLLVSRSMQTRKEMTTNKVHACGREVYS